ncbi:MAG: TonB family protein [Pedobacter sp.]|nr:MAG: TonB family protein [Pedobacter sp.]
MSWAHYLLQVNIYLLVFYGFYKLLLAKETYFTLNRIYLVSAGLLSLAIPFLRFEWFIRQPIAQPVYITVGQMNDYLSMVVVPENEGFFNAGNLMVLIYLAGVGFLTIKFIVRLISLKLLLNKGTKGLAFSFFNKKVIDNKLPEFRIINTHEDLHVKQYHSADVMFFEVLSIISWFNPIIYFYKYTVKNIHEYLADEEAARFQGDKEQYALLLLSSAFGVTPSNLTNSFFNKSLIKKRIYMLHKQRSKKTAVLKYGLFLPLFATTLVMSSATIRNNEKIQEFAEAIPLNQPLKVVKEAVAAVAEPATNAPESTIKLSTIPVQQTQLNAAAQDDDKVYDFVSLDKQPTFEGGMEKFYEYLKENLVYPETAKAEKIQGKVFLSFIVEKDGSLTDIKVDRKLGGGTDEEAVRVLSASPKWNPGTVKKETVRVKYNIPISFALADPKENTTADFVSSTVQPTAAPQQDDKVHDFTSLDVAPSFPGGMEKFYQFLKRTVKYPAEAQTNNISGKVFLSFIIEKSGALTDIKVDRGLGYGLDEEAIRVLKESPDWIPGSQKGKKVRVKYHIPLSFSLTK